MLARALLLFLGGRHVLARYHGTMHCAASSAARAAISLTDDDEADAHAKDARKAATADTRSRGTANRLIARTAPRRRAVFGDDRGSTGWGAPPRGATVSDHFLLRRMGEVIVRTTSLDHMDAVHFTARDRAGAIAGLRRELRLLKEMHLDAEGSAAPRARARRSPTRRRSRSRCSGCSGARSARTAT